MKPTSDSVQKTLDAELDKLDAPTLEKLRAIRRSAIDSASASSVAGVEVYAQAGQLSLLRYFVWRQTKWMLTGLALSICLVLVLFNRSEPVVQIDLSQDLNLYSEVDPEWLIDMEIAEVFGDE